MKNKNGKTERKNNEKIRKIKENRTKIIRKYKENSGKIHEITIRMTRIVDTK